MLRSVLLCITLTISLSGCSALAPLAKDALLGSGERGIQARANISKGDAEGQDSVAQNANTAVSLDAGDTTRIAGGVDRIVNENGMPLHVLLLFLLLAGWAIPSPGEMGNGFIRFVNALSGFRKQT